MITDLPIIPLKLRLAGLLADGAIYGGVLVVVYLAILSLRRLCKSY
jgi:hypothetical protein